MYYIVEQILFHQNYDINNLVTPVKIDRLKALLEMTKYSKEETNFIMNGFTNGFEISYTGNMNAKLTAPNLPLTEYGDNIILWNKIMKEVKAGRFVGPFDKIPFQHHYIQSPIGLVPKDDGRDKRLIFHLSYPKNKGTSVNANTPPEKCSVQYPDFVDAIQMCLRTGKNCRIS